MSSNTSSSSYLKGALYTAAFAGFAAVAVNQYRKLKPKSESKASSASGSSVAGAVAVAAAPVLTKEAEIAAQKKAAKEQVEEVDQYNKTIRLVTRKEIRTLNLRHRSTYVFVINTKYVPSLSRASPLLSSLSLFVFVSLSLSTYRVLVLSCSYHYWQR